MASCERKTISRQVKNGQTQRGRCLSKHSVGAWSKSIEAIFEKRKARVSAAALAAFTRQLSDLVSAGVSLQEALALLSSQTPSGGIKTLIQQSLQTLNAGGSFSQALRQRPKEINALYLQMIDVAEMNGQYDTSLQQLACDLQEKICISRKVRLAILYPAFVFVVGLISTGVFCGFVIPRIESLYEDFGASLPWLTRLLLGLSRLFPTLIGMSVLCLLGCGFLLTRKSSRDDFKSKAMTFLSSLPFINDLLIVVNGLSVSRSLAGLLKGGVDMVTAVGVIKKTTKDFGLQRQMESAQKKLKQGFDPSAAFKGLKIFPASCISILRVGDATGRLGDAFIRISEILKERLQEQTDVFIQLLGPTVLAVVVAFIALLAAAVMLPLMDMSNLVPS